MPWLMKAEPDTRIVKGKDVKFSVDDFERLGVSQWDGVRSFEARNIMRDRMRLGDKVLFYHSNTKIPGVFAIAEIAREGYPDCTFVAYSNASKLNAKDTAWDETHPYFDPKTDKDNPVWMMVDVKFVQRLPHPPTLALIKHLAATSSLPQCVDYIGIEGFQAIKAMQLVNRGRLSVQPVDQTAYEAVVLLGERGGWEGLLARSVKGERVVKEGKESEAEKIDQKERKGNKKKGVRVIEHVGDPPEESPRRSKRVKR